MPLPSKNPDENIKKFVQRCMKNDIMNKEYPDNAQRYAICINQTKKKTESNSLISEVCSILQKKMDDDLDFEDNVVDASNLIIPKNEDYVDFGEEVEEYIFETSNFKYKDPMTGEIYYFDMRNNHKKNGRTLVYVGKGSEYQGRKVQLNKPFRTPSGPKKFAVYVKNESGKVVIVRFGDPNMKIKKNIPERRKSFRARHNCDNPGPKWKARYWSCKAW
jgi:hypothetical protein